MDKGGRKTEPHSPGAKKRARNWLPSASTSTPATIETAAPANIAAAIPCENAQAFIDDLASRLRNRVQSSSDGLRMYTQAIESRFGVGIDYAQVAKAYEAEPVGPGRYGPPRVASVDRYEVLGWPDLSKASTSIVERQNLTMRTHMRRLTRLSLGFSKKLENLKAAVALRFAYYNLVRRHGSLRMTPAMAAGVMPDFWRVEDLVGSA